ncbi:MAG: 50S ribosomal protein L11 methyltransferase [Chloroflexi bacterium]|nr:50S ribosomal protein L11 methyltransferase [Chloroflexota bacterium]
MDWLELSIQAPAEYVEPLSEIFRRYSDGNVAVQTEGDWDPDNDPGQADPPSRITITAYLRLDDTLRSRKAMIDVGVRLVSHLQPLGALQERVLAEKEWETAWKAHFTVLRVGRRIVLKPTWHDYAPKPGDAVVELDPGMAFGTGHHPTTRMCLEELDRRVQPGSRALDVGTGSGILAITAARLGAAHVVGLDIDGTAVQAARENVTRNGVAGKVRVYPGSLPHPEAPAAAFDIVVANITAGAIAALAGELAQTMAQDGTLIASGIIAQRQAEAEDAIQRYLTITSRRQDGDWLLLTATHQA